MVQLSFIKEKKRMANAHTKKLDLCNGVTSVTATAKLLFSTILPNVSMYMEIYTSVNLNIPSPIENGWLMQDYFLTIGWFDGEMVHSVLTKLRM
jgi:hypothetical protein